MDRITITELRDHTARVIDRVQAGERMVITADGVDMAEIGPPPSIEDLVREGRLIPPAKTGPRPRARLVKLTGGLSSEEILDELRVDRF